MKKERRKQVYLAKLYMKAERYDDMVEAMKKIARFNGELTIEERDLLSIGYKNVIDAKRDSWRKLSFIEKKEELRGNDQNVKKIRDYRTNVEDELSKICYEVLSIIVDKHLLLSATSGETSVFYYKMKGDYFRYLAEFKSGGRRDEAANESLKAYEAATTLASSEFVPAHPIRLCLALNVSVFYYEILNSPERACHLAKQALDEPLIGLGSLSKLSFEVLKRTRQYFIKNLTLWTSDLEEAGEQSEGNNRQDES